VLVKQTAFCSVFLQPLCLVRRRKSPAVLPDESPEIDHDIFLSSIHSLILFGTKVLVQIT
jgi:hypothetical protein